jgi:GrpB-like predicted nucleotidyltransferase (UPF0157 family)
MLSAHDCNWFAEFAALKAVLCEALDDVVLGIEHVGSTAVPDLLAKPILDIDVVMRDYSVFPEVVQILRQLGYEHVGDQGIFQREVFKPKGVAPDVFRAEGWMPHHLYVCPSGGAELNRHLRFRNALRENPNLRREYEEMKARIAARSGNDRRRYAEIKERECGAFIQRVLGQTEQAPAGDVGRKQS